MDEKKLHAILKPCMILIILILAYFLPRTAFRETPGGGTNQVSMTEKAETENEQAEVKTQEHRDLIILDPGHGGYR